MVVGVRTYLMISVFILVTFQLYPQLHMQIANYIHDYHLPSSSNGLGPPKHIGTNQCASHCQSQGFEAVS